MIASAPGKLILTGEYAVLDGAPALVIAVARRAVARFDADSRDAPSPFLAAVADELAGRGFTDAAARARKIRVDSAAFYDGAQKLGLGSSAAVAVAATALAVAATGVIADTAPPPPVAIAGVAAAAATTTNVFARETATATATETAASDRALVVDIASAAHARAQGARGARGSGADIAASTYGGAIEFTAATARAPRGLRWPDGVVVVPFFTGASADTAQLVAAVAARRAATDRAPAVEAALAAITAASRAACDACATRDPAIAATGLVAALAHAARATDQLAAATGLPLVPRCVTDVRAALAGLGGTAKTTGAGGGDVAIAVVPAGAELATVHRAIAAAGGAALILALDHTGVDLRADAQ